MAPSEEGWVRLDSTTGNVDLWTGGTLQVRCLLPTFGQAGLAAAGKLESLRTTVVPVEADRSVSNRHRLALGPVMAPHLPSTLYSSMPTKPQWTCFRL